MAVAALLGEGVASGPSLPGAAALVNASNRAIHAEAFHGDPNPIRRRLHLVNLLTQEYAAYEDAGAMLNALLDYREGKVKVPIASLVVFATRRVELATMFEGQGHSTQAPHSPQD